ncbi:ABC transporter ATP-binding protein [Candidatus Woesearchaeota archaeon]|nr:ABC transporter ATP-binding protein [Candidatus Woesearchaeota archaeon]
MNSIEVRSLSKSFGDVKAVDSVSFSVKKGEFFGLLGPNGAGKTTTINMLTGLLEKDSGEISILGKNPNEDWEYVKNRMNVSTAYFPISDVLTVRQALNVYSRIFGVKDYKRKISELLVKFELSHLQDRRIILLSSGERTRVAIAKGLLNDPEVLFLDECTVGLDPDIADKTRTLMREYQKEKGAAIFFTSHYMFEVEMLCGRIGFMINGRLLNVDTSANLKRIIRKTTVEMVVKEGRAKLLRDFLLEEDVDVLFMEDNRVAFEVASSGDRLYRLMNKIFAQGFKLSDLHIKRPTLEDLFIKLARRK